MTFAGSSGMALQRKAVEIPPLPSVASGAWRFHRREENVTGLCWAVAIASCFFLVGALGLVLRPPPFEITLGGRAGLGASDAETTELTMAELQAMEEAPEVVNEAETPEEVPEPVEIPVELPDLPELAEALVSEDVFTVPAAPKIEEVLQPVDPAAPKPKAKPKPQPKPAIAQPRRATSPVVTKGGTQGSGGGNGGSLATGSGSGKGRMPKPNYPSTARARGVSGTIKLALTIGVSGRVESAIAVSSQGGFYAQEQDAVASQVQRTWSFPPGAPRKFTAPIVFKLGR